MSTDALPGLGDIVRIDPDTARFRVITARAGTAGWVYLTGWPLDALPAEQTRHLKLSRVTVLERA